MASSVAEEGERSACLALDAGEEQQPTEPASGWRRHLPFKPQAKHGLLLVGLAAAAVAGGKRAAHWLRESNTDVAAVEPDRRTGRGEFLVLQEQLPHEGCAKYFSVGKDCSQKNLWECVGDDGSLAFKCCCKHGFGDFSYDNNRAPGMINWAEHPAKCIDLSMPYVGSGVPFKDGHAMLGSCNWGNPNKIFHLPLSGKGHIHWATHPKFCLGVKGGANAPGSMLDLQRCAESPEAWTTFNLSTQGFNQPHQIRSVAAPNLCVQVVSSTDGAPITLAPCLEHETKQRFTVTMPPKPPPYADVPSLFCIALMLPRSYERGMIHDQLMRKVGIAECNDHAVYSNESITLTPDKRTDVMDGSLAVEFGGRWHSALNTDVFIRFWGKVIEDPRTWNHTWTLKVDPDCVFFPSRLREILRSRWYSGNPKSAVYLNNCHNGMHGPIEVVSQQGLKVYKDRWLECKNGEPYLHKQEDFYFRRCWALLNISKVDVYNLLFENLYACDERSDTRDGRHPCFSRQVAFHPFKTSQSYFECYRRGQAMQWVAPMVVNGDEPSSQNFHHA